MRRQFWVSLPDTRLSPGLSPDGRAMGRKPAWLSRIRSSVRCRTSTPDHPTQCPIGPCDAGSRFPGTPKASRSGVGFVTRLSPAAVFAFVPPATGPSPWVDTAILVFGVTLVALALFELRVNR